MDIQHTDKFDSHMVHQQQWCLSFINPENSENFENPETLKFFILGAGAPQKPSKLRKF